MSQVHAGDTSRTVVHRVGLFNRGGHITNIISQSDVVRWLGQQLSGLGALQHKTMQELGWASKNIKSLPAGTPAIQVNEKRMIRHSIAPKQDLVCS